MQITGNWVSIGCIYGSAIKLSSSEMYYLCCICIVVIRKNGT